LVESSTGLALESVLKVVFVSAAETPWGGEVLLAEEAPHIVAEGLASVGGLSIKVISERYFVFGGHRVVAPSLVLFLLDVVVKLLGHRVVQREALVGSEDVTYEAKRKGQERSESLESVRKGLSSGFSGHGAAICSELHGEVSVLGVHI